MKRQLCASLLGLALSACSHDGESTVSLSARTRSTGSALTLDNGIVLERVRMAIRDIELKPATADAGVDDSSGTAPDDDEAIASGPFLVDLQGSALEGGVQRLFSVKAPTGDYRRIRFDIHKVEDSDGETFAGMENLSILVEGTKDGSPFTFESAVNERQEYEGDFTLEEGENALLLDIDPSGWFTGGNGAVLDPEASESESEIESNIKDSIRAVKDSSED